MIAKVEQLVKAYKQEEKTFISGVQKISKDVVSNNEKVGKSTATQEK
jgi:hypothetical protein